jgi:hypothetical protein
MSRCVVGPAADEAASYESRSTSFTPTIDLLVGIDQFAKGRN